MSNINLKNFMLLAGVGAGFGPDALNLIREVIDTEKIHEDFMAQEDALLGADNEKFLANVVEMLKAEFPQYVRQTAAKAA